VTLGKSLYFDCLILWMRCGPLYLSVYARQAKDRVQLSTGFIQKKTLSIPVSWRVFIRKNWSRTLRLIHDGISFDKILPKQVGYFGTRINWKQAWKIENSIITLAVPLIGSALFWDNSDNLVNFVLPSHFESWWQTCFVVCQYCMIMLILLFRLTLLASYGLATNT
jgi:hypothetical protein